jgi:hypothetical protein
VAGRFAIDAKEHGETALFYKDEQYSPDGASEIILSRKLFPEKGTAGFKAELIG